MRAYNGAGHSGYSPTAEAYLTCGLERLLLASPEGVTTIPPSQIWKTYYFAGTQAVAMRVEGDPISANNGVFFLHSDHLGSASLTTNVNGVATARQMYDAWGNIRASASSGTMPTDIGYTGQRLDSYTMLRTSRLLIILVFTVVLSGCVGDKTPVNLSTATTERIASPTHVPTFVPPSGTPDPDCIPPCFYGITPGQTTLTEALSLLNAAPLQVNPEGNLRWETIDPPRPWRSDSRPVTNYIWFRDGVVSSIQLAERHAVSLGDIAVEYGEPAVIALGRPGHINLFDFTFLYPSKGLAFVGTRASTMEDEVKGIIPTPDIPVMHKVYFPPVSPVKITKELVARQLVGTSVVIRLCPWNGFGEPICEP